MNFPGKTVWQEQRYRKCAAWYERETERQKDRYAQFLKSRGEALFVPEAEQAAGEAGLAQGRSGASAGAAGAKQERLARGRSGAWAGAAGAKQERPAQEGAGQPGFDLALPSGEGYAAAQAGDAVIFFLTDGFPDREAFARIAQAFAQDEGLLLAYGHEDFVTEDGKRHSPWCKPRWSPDTLRFSFYFGSLFAVRRRVVETWRQRRSGSVSYPELGRALAALCEEITGDILSNDPQPPIRLLDAFLYHRPAAEEEADAWLPPERGAGESTGTSAQGFAGEDADAPARHSAGEDADAPSQHAASLAALREACAADGVSVIIPSRDNPDTLGVCLRALQKTAGFVREILVIDNGSNETNRRRLEAMAKTVPFRYVYRPEPFHFSRMCNCGAELANGKYLLFLNDDVEAVSGGWLERMYEEARRPLTGAVGVKLRYPETDLIQHAGVTNLQAGPSHKLLRCADSKVYYHGKNRGRHDMLAVTAACLLVAREKFEAVGGFPEAIAVSFNDVDFCFSLYEKGWYNVQCNDAWLWHHESLSRGDDAMSEEKWERLLLEKQTLFQRHPALKGQDPFYSPLLAGHFSDYLCSYEYEYEQRAHYTGVSDYRLELLWKLKQWGKRLSGKGAADVCQSAAGNGAQHRGAQHRDALRHSALRSGVLPAEWQNECLIVHVEHARKEQKLDLTEQEEVWWIEGWAYVLDMDNARYKKEVLLREETEGRLLRAETMTRYRKDVEAVLPRQTNVALSGFSCRILRQHLPPGRYRVALLASDRCSGQRLYRESEVVLSVE